MRIVQTPEQLLAQPYDPAKSVFADMPPRQRLICAWGEVQLALTGLRNCANPSTATTTVLQDFFRGILFSILNSTVYALESELDREREERMKELKPAKHGPAVLTESAAFEEFAAKAKIIDHT